MKQFNSELAKQFNLPIQALDQLIDRRIMLMEAKEIGLRATDEEVRDAILDIPVFQDVDGNFVGADQYERILRGNRMTVSDFEDSLRDDLLITKLNSILSQTSYVSDSEVEKSYRDQAERAEIRFIQLPAAEFASEVSASQEDLESYFEEHQTDYELPEQRVADYLLVDTVQLRREIEIPEEELRAFYDGNPDDFTREEQVRARHILLRITPDRSRRAGRERAPGGPRPDRSGRGLRVPGPGVLRGREQQCPRRQSGLFRTRLVWCPSSRKRRSTPRSGELVGPVKTDFGYHLIEVQEKREGGLQPFEQVEATVRSRLLGERVEEIAEAKARDLSERITHARAVDGRATRSPGDRRRSHLAKPPSRSVPATNIVGVGRAPDFQRRRLRPPGRWPVAAGEAASRLGRPAPQGDSATAAGAARGGRDRGAAGGRAGIAEDRRGRAAR